MENFGISQLYSELSTNTPNIITLAGRCKLLTEILLDCDTLSQTQPVCRCLSAYLNVFHSELEKSMTDFRIVEFHEDNQPPQPKAWLLADTETQYDYCRVLNHVLLVSHFDSNLLPHLTGLLHDVTCYMVDDLITMQSENDLKAVIC